MNTSALSFQFSERKIIGLCCLVAAVHTLIFSAAFPFFSTVDEQAHFDLVVHYSQADLPRTVSHTGPAALPYLVYYSSSEYLYPPGTQPGGVYPTPWTYPADVVAQELAPRKQMWREVVLNHEVAQPPLYYIFAGAWWRLGQFLHLKGFALLYFLRFLNVIILVAITWLAGVTAFKIFPADPFLKLAVPALAALFPQSIFYALNNDVLSPLTSGIAFLLLLKFFTTENPPWRLAVANGLALGAVYLTKTSNLPVLAVSGLFLLLKCARLCRARRFKAAGVNLLLLILCAGLPVAAWMTWCQANFGDLTGTAQKIKFLNWTVRPFSEWLHHPIFSPAGLWYFIQGNLATFWHGEQMWQGSPSADPTLDSLYALATLVVLGFAVAAFFRRRSDFTPEQRAAIIFSFIASLALFIFFALLSVKYDFHDCFYPSKEHPFFVSGRLWLGMFIPFLLLFALGLDQLLKRYETPVKCGALFILLGLLLVLEIAADWPVFASQFNLFHVPLAYVPAV